MWCSWKVFVCRHDSGDGFIAYFVSFLHHHFHRTKSDFKCYTKHFWIGCKQTCAHVNSTQKSSDGNDDDDKEEEEYNNYDDDDNNGTANTAIESNNCENIHIIYICYKVMQCIFVDGLGYFFSFSKLMERKRKKCKHIAFLIAPVVPDECRKITIIWL